MGIKKVSILVANLLSLSLMTMAQKFSAEQLMRFNSSYDEQNPVLSTDGNYLFITRSNHPQNIGGLKDPGDIWIAHFNGVVWSEPVHGGSELNDKGYNVVIGTSEDGRQLFLAHHVSKDSEPAKTQGISVASFNGSTWTTPVTIPLPYFHSRTPAIRGHLSHDGNYFVYAADTYGSYGVEDIYMVQRITGGWSEPLNLGLQINTSFQELAPSLNRANDTLYFSSNGRKGAGGFDVYAAARLDGSWANWSEPKNLQDINTEGRELYYLPLGNGNALYTSTLNSDGYGDLKFYNSGQTIPADSSRIPDTTKDSVVVSLDKRILKGSVLNAKTLDPINAQLTFVLHEKRELLRAGASGYSIELPDAGMYHVTIEAVGYISTFESLVIDTLQRGTLEVDFRLQPIEVGATVNLKSVLFKQSSTDLLPESKEELDVVVSFMKSNAKVKIELTGHTDNRGVHKDNVALSAARVKKVKAYLVEKGIATKRISGKGYGGMKPIAANDSEESRRLNRRVEFTILKN